MSGRTELGMEQERLSEGAMVAAFTVGASLTLYAHQFGIGPALLAGCAGCLAVATLALLRVVARRVDLKAAILALLDGDVESR